MLLGLGDYRVLGVGEDDEGLLVEVETPLDVDAVRCPNCGTSVVLDGTEELGIAAPHLRTSDGARLDAPPLPLRERRLPVETFLEEAPPLRPA